jgi:DNA-binding SARP family transcriptional activator
MPAIEIGLLGSTQLSLAAPAHTSAAQARTLIPSARQRTVLALLALRNGRAVSADELIDELWGERPPAKARNALQATVARLRRALRTEQPATRVEGILHTAGAGYLLDVPDDAVDAHRFVNLAEEGMRDCPATPRTAILALHEALQLWRGKPLCDSGSGLRCQAAAARLDEVRIIALEELLAAQLIVGPPQAVLGPLRELSVQYPERERVCGLLMTALTLSGRQTEALNEFHRTRRWLAEELGLRPSDALQERYTSILRAGSLRNPQPSAPRHDHLLRTPGVMA